MKKLTLLTTLLLAGCALGPDYKKPEIPVSSAFRQALANDPELQQRWQPVDTVTRPQSSGPWWESWWHLSNEHELSRWLAEVAQANPTVDVLAAQFRQADAVLAASRASWWPTLSTSVTSSRAQGVVGSTVVGGNDIRITDKVNLSASWELDLWGRIGRGVESSKAALEASKADWQAGILSAQSTFAQTYLQWQSNHRQQTLLGDAVKAYTRMLEITRSRHEVGVVGRADVLQAEAQLNSTRAQWLDLGIQQAQLEHAMAVLLGKVPAESRAPSPDNFPGLPAVPALLPAQLLLSRPDVAAAERRVAAANAQIGVAQAAYFPTITLGASQGYQDDTFSHIISASNLFWSVGPTVALTLFDGGYRSAVKAQAVAVHQQRTASYRQTVLSAIQEVEDQLATLRVLSSEENAQADAVASAKQAQAIAEYQYQAGVVAFLNVLTAQTTALSAERSLQDLRLRRALAGIALIKAVGGGWDSVAASDTAKK